MTPNTTDTDGNSPDEDGDAAWSEFNPDPPGDIAFVTTGGPIRSYLQSITTGVGIDEVKLRIDTDGLHISAVDPANVGMAVSHFPRDALTGMSGDIPDADGATDGRAIGIPLTTSPGLIKSLSYARKGRGSDPGDPVRVDIYDRGSSTRVRVATLRPDDGTKRVSEFYALDPGSLRSEPSVPDLDLEYRADPDPSTLSDAVDAVNYSDHVRIRSDHRTLILETTHGDEGADEIHLPNTAWSVTDPDADATTDGSLISEDYLTPAIDGINAADANSLTLKFDAEFPLILKWESTETGINGRYAIAPRIPSE